VFLAQVDTIVKIMNACPLKVLTIVTIPARCAKHATEDNVLQTQRRRSVNAPVALRATDARKMAIVFGMKTTALLLVRHAFLVMLESAFGHARMDTAV
jgi:hypothetical protein